MSSLKSVLPRYLRTSRLTLELFDYSPEHYSCLITSMNTPTAHKNMGDFGIRTAVAFDKLNFATRLHPSVFAEPTIVDTDIYYLVHLGNRAGPLIGGVSIAQRGAHVPPDMGWALLEEYHRHGYATEAAKELLRMAQSELGISQVMAWPGRENLPSIKVAKGIGLVDERVAKDETGEEHITYLLPGTQFEEGVTIHIHGS